jgi:serine/threonine protein kinase
MTNGTTPRQERVDELIADFLQQIEAGIPVTPDQWLNLHREYRTELADFFANHQQLERLAGPLRIASDPLTLLEPERRLGDFLIRREIGRGGMGVVYDAEQVSLGRRVALKMPSFAGMLDEHQLRRFKNQVHGTAVLKHPNIVSVFYVGCERGVHFYAMPFIDGLSLAEIITFVGGALRDPVAPSPPSTAPSKFQMRFSKSPAARKKTPTLLTQPDVETVSIVALETALSSPSTKRARRVAELGIQAARALDFAHHEGVIHRDIKPSNLLVDRDGKLWITDFGLARVQGSGDKTTSGNVAGTLRYMSPEQLVGGQVVDQRTDVYSLGVTLYELLTLRPAFEQRDREQLMRQILEREPTPARRIDPSIPVDLETIVTRAMTKERELRYQSAQDLADDLQRFLDNRSIMARPAGRVERLWRWYKRSPLVAALSAVILLLSIALTGSAVFVAYHETSQRKVAEENTKEARWQQYLSDMHVAVQAWDDAQPAVVRQIPDRHVPAPGQVDNRGFEWRYLAESLRATEESVATLNEELPVRQIAFSSDGRWLATSDFAEQGSIWDVVSRKRLKTIHAPGSDLLKAVAISPDDRRIAYGCSDGAVRLFDVATGQLHKRLEFAKDWVQTVAFSPDGRWLATASNSGELSVYDLHNELRETPFSNKELPKYCVTFSPDSRYLAATFDTSVGIWETGTWREISVFKGHTADLNRGRSVHAMCVAFHHDGQLVASGDTNGSIKLWNPANGELT